MYIELLKDIYTNSSMTVHIHKESHKIDIRRGVRQGDILSPKLFMAALERIFRRLTWETRGLNIEGENISHLSSADGILIRGNTPHELQQMLLELADESGSQGLKVNNSKTSMIRENGTPTYVNNTQIENATSIWDTDITAEKKINTKKIQRRTSFDYHRDILKGNTRTCF